MISDVLSDAIDAIEQYENVGPLVEAYLPYAEVLADLRKHMTEVRVMLDGGLYAPPKLRRQMEVRKGWRVG